MKFEIEFDLEEGDILQFNDEEWVVTNFDAPVHVVDVQSVGTGRVECFTEEELQKQIAMSGRFSRINGDYVGLF